MLLSVIVKHDGETVLGQDSFISKHPPPPDGVNTKLEKEYDNTLRHTQNTSVLLFRPR